MEPQLTFSEISMEVSDLGPDSVLPDILGELNIQNKANSILNEYEEIFISQAKHKAKLIKIKDISFYEVLYNKLTERGV